MHMQRLLTSILIGLLVLLLVACGGGATSAGEDLPASPSGGAGTSWVEVETLKGVNYTTHMTSSPFELQGGQQEIAYEVSGDGAIRLTVYVEQVDATPTGERGVPVVSLTAAGKDTVRLNKGEGVYKVMIDSVDCDWKLTIAELR